MTDIYKTKEIQTNINERGVNLGNVDVTLYTMDKGTAAFKIYLKKEVDYDDNNKILDAVNLYAAKMTPRLDIVAEDGSTFSNEPIDIINPESGVIQYVVSDYVIRHKGKMDAYIYLENKENSVQVASFYFYIEEDGVSKSLGNEVRGGRLEDVVKSVMSGQLMELLSQDYREQLNREIKSFLKDNNKDFNLRFEDLTREEKDELMKNITNQGLADFKIADNSITGVKVARNTLLPENTAFIKTGKNIFRLQEAIQNKVVSYTTGEVSDSQYFATSQFEPISPGTQYTQNISEVVAFYDINKKFISGMSRDSNSKPRTFITPANAYYLRTSPTTPTAIQKYQIELGNQSTTFEDYYRRIDYLKTDIKNESVDNDKLVNGTITLDKLKFVDKSINLFDKNSATIGNYIQPTTGALFTNSAYYASDFINIEGISKITKTNNQNLYAFYDKNKNYISNKADATQTIVVPNNATYIRYAGKTSDINKDMLVAGEELPSSYVPYALYIPKRYLEGGSDTARAIGGFSNETSDSYGKQFLKTYTSDFSKQLNKKVEEKAEIAIIGDSWVQGGEFRAGDRLTVPLKDRLLKIYEDGGIGFIGLANNHLGNGLVNVTLNGSWTEYDAHMDIGPQAKGLDTAMVESSTAGDSIKVQFYEELDFYEVHTLNNGTWRYNIDGGEWKTVDASKQEVTPINMTLGKHTINIEIVNGKVTFIGSYAYKGKRGIVIHKIGNGGLKGSHMTATDRDNYIKQIKRCRANTFGILLGTNDMSANVPIEDYKKDLKEIISRIRTAKPLASIFLVAPSGNQYDGNKLHTMEDYSNAQLQLAKELNIAHVSLYRNLGDFNTTNSNGLMYKDGVHPNENGGFAISNVVYDRLLRL